MFDQVWIKALFILLIHLSATKAKHWLAPRERLINAFGGGMALSYVFLHLMPEIAEGKEHLGQYTFFVVLLGYLIYYLINLNKRRNPNRAEVQEYRANLAGVWLYSFIFIVGLPDDYQQKPIHIFLMTIAIGMHLVHEDFELASKHENFFTNRGRYLLALAPILGLAARWFFLPDSDLFGHIVTSILAGSIIYSVARKEIPNPSRTSLLWFLAGIITYAGLLVLIELF